MAGFENNEVPILSDTRPQLLDERGDSKFQAFMSRTRSSSISIPMNFMDSYKNVNNLVGHTGPLRNERRTPFIQMSGPLYVSRKPENISWLSEGVKGPKMVDSSAEVYPSFNSTVQNDWPDDNYVAKNEHLLKSGQLGICNDSYCTICPTYYNFEEAQRRNSKASGIFDSKKRLCGRRTQTN